MTQAKGTAGSTGATQDSRTGARERAIDAYDSARERAAAARDQVRSSVGDNAFVALGGGLALGAVLAALLPTSRRERELVGPYADRLKDRASDAIGAAKEAGVARLGELGITKDAGRDVIRQIIDGATDAARTSAKAAAGSARGR